MYFLVYSGSLPGLPKMHFDILGPCSPSAAMKFREIRPRLSALPPHAETATIDTNQVSRVVKHKASNIHARPVLLSRPPQAIRTGREQSSDVLRVPLQCKCGDTFTDLADFQDHAEVSRGSGGLEDRRIIAVCVAVNCVSSLMDKTNVALTDR